MDSVITQISKTILLYGTNFIICLIILIGTLYLINLLLKIPVEILNLIAKKFKFLWLTVKLLRYKEEFNQFLKDKKNEN
jgi:hypothetical protein